MEAVTWQNFIDIYFYYLSMYFDPRLYLIAFFWEYNINRIIYVFSNPIDCRIDALMLGKRNTG